MSFLMKLFNIDWNNFFDCSRTVSPFLPKYCHTFFEQNEKFLSLNVKDIAAIQIELIHFIAFVYVSQNLTTDILAKLPRAKKGQTQETNLPLPSER